MNSEFANRMRTSISYLSDFCAGRLKQRTLLWVLIPLIGLSYFGSLTLAIWLFPGPFDWRTRAMSKLLYPRNNPRYHAIGAAGVAVAGAAMIPFAGYIRNRIRAGSPVVASIGSLIFGAGAVSLILGGLIVAQPYHDFFARGAGICAGLGMAVFYLCALRGLAVRANESDYLRRTLLMWNLTVPPALLIVVLRLLAAVHLRWPNPVYRAIENRALWHLGFWEWIGSAAAFMFLLGAALCLPNDNAISGSLMPRGQRP